MTFQITTDRSEPLGAISLPGGCDHSVLKVCLVIDPVKPH